MKKLCEDIISYIEFISKEYNLSISIHYAPGYGGEFLKFPALSFYNNHYNPYCMSVKSKAFGHRKCIECQKKVLKKCVREPVFRGVCHAGVEELVFAISRFGFISISGYGKNNPYLKNEEPPESLCKTLISPLVVMLQKLFEEVGRSEENDEILNYINLNYTHITLDELCEKFHKSRSAISHSFKKKNGVTLKTYCNNLKLRDAEIMLKNSELSVSEICYSVGFESFSYFISLFKARTGMTPLKYRKT